MSGALYKLGEMPFAATDTVFYQHNLDREQVGVMVIVNGEQQNAAITSIQLSPADPRNALTVSLSSVLSGSLLLVDSDYIWSAIPTPEEKAALQSAGVFGSGVTVDGPSAMQQTTSNQVWLTAAQISPVLAAGARYFVAWEMDLKQDQSQGVEFRITWADPGGGTLARTYEQKEKANELHPRGGSFATPPAVAGAHVFTLQFRAQHHNKNVRCVNASLVGWRVQ